MRTYADLHAKGEPALPDGLEELLEAHRAEVDALPDARAEVDALLADLAAYVPEGRGTDPAGSPIPDVP